MAYDFSQNINPMFGIEYPKRPGGFQTQPGGANKNALLEMISSPEFIVAAMQGGLGIGTNVLNAKHEANLDSANRRQRLAEALASTTGDELNDDYRRQGLYLQSLEMDPTAQAKHQFRSNLLRDLSNHGPVRVTHDQGVMNPFQPSEATRGFVAPDALAENASRFYSAAGQINPMAQRPNLEAMGYGEAGARFQPELDTTINDAAARYEDLNAQRKAELIAGFGDEGESQQPKKSSGGFLKKLLAGIGMGASAFIPGMPAVLGPYLLGAGFGTATGGLRGGVAGAAGVGMGQGKDYFTRGK